MNIQELPLKGFPVPSEVPHPNPTPIKSNKNSNLDDLSDEEVEIVDQVAKKKSDQLEWM